MGKLIADYTSTLCLTSVSDRYDDRDFYVRLTKVVASVTGNRDSWPFREPVDPKAVPMYHQVIEEPIDLSIIKSRVEEKLYKSIRDLELDFKLMVNNCETFNGPKNGYTSMVYAVWRAFRRAVNRYFDQDLEEDEQTVFLYPPKPRDQSVPTAAIAARRKKNAARHRKRMKALEVLERAALIAVRDTQTSQSSSPYSSPSPHHQETDFVIFDDVSRNSSRDGSPLSGDELLKYLYNASNDSTLTAFYVDANDNLSFKSLTEWSESIKNSGNQIILPQDTVVISSNAQINAMHANISEKERNFSALTLLHISGSKSPKSRDPDVRKDDTQIRSSSDTCRSKRTLVIKLSRCSESGKMWRPVHIVTDQAN